MKHYLWISAGILLAIGAYQGDTSISMSGTIFVVGYAVCHHIDKRLGR